MGDDIQKQQDERGSSPVQLSKVSIGLWLISPTFLFLFWGIGLKIFFFSRFIQFLGRGKDDGVRRSAVSGKKVDPNFFAIFVHCGTIATPGVCLILLVL